MIECRRSLHTNYNCTDLERVERWYTTLFGMRSVMRSASAGTSGEAFGIYQETTSDTVFLYDHRGGRRANALELVRWTDPATTGRPYPTPWHRGIQSVGFSVPDLDEVASAAGADGGAVVHRSDGAALLRDPEGVAVEVAAGGERAEMRQLRIVCSDLDRTVAWYERLGMRPAPYAPVIRGEDVWAGDGEHAIVAERPYVATDDATFAFVFTAWSGAPPDGPTYAMPYHRGLYRMAIAVDDVHAAYAALRELGLVRQPPHTFALPGTPITDGLTIQFLRDPDGILVELVERPRSFFAE